MTSYTENANPDSCLFTRETVRNMVRYIKDDKRIAQYCGVSIDTVAMVRRNMVQGDGYVSTSKLTQPGCGVDTGDGEGAVWRSRMDAKRGSDRLLEAIRAVGA